MEEDPSKTYRNLLNMMTYSTSSAPYLARRVLRQIDLDNNAKYPVISEAILRDFYVDDLLTQILWKRQRDQRRSYTQRA